VRLLLRADSGFCREDLMAWCEANRVDYVFGLARNPRLTGEIATEMAAARAAAETTGKPARRFKDVRWSTRDSWSRIRRVIGKAEWTAGEANPRFIVTSLPATEIDARRLYERVYCARGAMENRIKACPLDRFADRTSAATMPANQVRLWFASVADVRLCALRRIGLAFTQFARASCASIRRTLLKIGALVRVSVRQGQRASGSACAGSIAPWPRRVRISTSLPWRMPCCAAPAPEPHEPDTARPQTPPQRYPRVARGKCVQNPANPTPSATSA
jgi:hypothetical protein